MPNAVDGLHEPRVFHVFRRRLPLSIGFLFVEADDAAGFGKQGGRPRVPGENDLLSGHTGSDKVGRELVHEVNKQLTD